MTPYSKLKKGTLLIASPEVEDPLFARSVMLLCDHSDIGSLGLILNKPLEFELPEEVFSSDFLNGDHIHFSTGGPMHNDQVMLLHSSPQNETSSLEVCEGVYLGGDLEFLQSAAEKEAVDLLLCFGYCGFNAGSLEKEFLNNEWFLFPGSQQHVFTTPREELWKTLLREMGGKYATFSMLPDDLSQN